MIAALLGISLFVTPGLPEPQFAVGVQSSPAISLAEHSPELSSRTFAPQSACPEHCWQADDDDDLCKELIGEASPLVQLLPRVGNQPLVLSNALSNRFLTFNSTLPDLIHVFCTLLI